MIKLDYRTNNRRWGWSGMEFTDWNSFSLTLGFLSNISHYKGRGKYVSIWDNAISVHIEHNELQGADAKQGRIHFYKNEADLQAYLTDLYLHRSAGVKPTITCRTNSNDYVLSLINDFGFITKRYVGYDTVDIFPSDNAYNTVWSLFENWLMANNYGNNDIDSLKNNFDYGWKL